MKVNEKTLLKTPVFEVVEKEFDDTSFKPVGLNCQDWVMVIARDSEDTNPVCVFVDQTRWGGEYNTVEFPCGTVEPKEGLKQAACREFKEETGIEIKPEDLTFEVSFNPNPAYFNNQMTIYSYTNRNLITKFFEREKQSLDENENCKVFIERLDNVKDRISLHAMSFIGYQILKLKGLK